MPVESAAGHERASPLYRLSRITMEITTSLGSHTDSSCSFLCRPFRFLSRKVRRKVSVPLSFILLFASPLYTYYTRICIHIYTRTYAGVNACTREKAHVPPQFRLIALGWSLFLSLSLLWPLFSPWNYHFLVYVLHAWTWRRTASSVNRLPDSRLQVRFGGFEGYRWSRTAAFSLFLSSSIGCRGLCWIKTVVPDDYAVFSPPCTVINLLLMLWLATTDWRGRFRKSSSPLDLKNNEEKEKLPSWERSLTKLRLFGIDFYNFFDSFVRTEISSYRKEFCIINIDRRCSTLFV